VSRAWAGFLVAEAVGAAGLFLWAGWGSGALFGLSGVPLRLLATLVTIGSVILLRLVFVMTRHDVLLRIGEGGILGREPSGDLWPDVNEFWIPWDQLAAVEVVGSVMQRVQLLDRYARAHTVSLTMVAGFKGGEGKTLAGEIRQAHAEWRNRAEG
jgi:hypothetical protein